MTRQTITPRDREHWLSLRAQDLTSTDVAALFGMSPYKTKFELWHEKRSGEPVRIAQNDRMKWGTRLQDSIASGIAHDNGFSVDRFDGYMRIPSERIGSSFDFFMEPNGILEIKNVDALIFRDGWIVENGEIEAPLHIEMQVQGASTSNTLKAVTFLF